MLSLVLILADSFRNTIHRLYGNNPVAHHVNHIFPTKIPCRLVFYIKEMKFALSILYVINRVFLANKVL